MRQVSAARIAAVLGGSVARDAVARSMVPMGFMEGAHAQLRAYDHGGARATFVVADVREYPSLEAAFLAEGEGAFLMPGEGPAEYAGEVAANRPPPGAPVVTYAFANPAAAPPRPEDQFFPPSPPGQNLYDVIYFRAPDGGLCDVSVHATNLGDDRRTVTSSRVPGAQPSPHIEGAQRRIAEAQTTVLVNRTYPGGEIEQLHSYQFNSAPMYAYAEASELAKGPPSIATDLGILLPWKSQSLIFSRGVEAMRCTIIRACGYIVIVYERQLAVLPVYAKEELGGAEIALVVGTPEITIKILEAAAELLQEEGDAAVVLVYTPETCAVTSNDAVGWHVAQTNVPPQRVSEAYARCGQKSLHIPTLDEAIKHLSSSWRNSLHVRYPGPNGTQVIVFNPKMALASRASSLPLAHFQLSECHLGTTYFQGAFHRAAMECLSRCAWHAVNRDTLENGNVLQNSLSIIYDAPGVVSYQSMLAVLDASFKEIQIATPDGPEVRLAASPDFIAALDNTKGELLTYVHAENAERLITKKGYTGNDIFEAYMERLLRALITTLYVNYGHHGIASADTRPGRLHLAHSIYRTAIHLINSLKQTQSLIMESFDWLGRNKHIFTEDFRKIWESAEYKAKGDRTRGPGGAPAPEASTDIETKRKHRDLVLAFTINRDLERYSLLLPFITEATALRALESRPAQAPEQPPRNTTKGPDGHRPSKPKPEERWRLVKGRK